MSKNDSRPPSHPARAPSSAPQEEATAWPVLAPTLEEPEEMETLEIGLLVNDEDAGQAAYDWQILSPAFEESNFEVDQNICPLIYFEEPEGGGDGLSSDKDNNIELLKFHLSQAEIAASSCRPKIAQRLKAMQCELVKPRRSSPNQRPPLDLSKIKLPPRLKWPSYTYSQATAKGENIVFYLNHAWRDLIAAGIGTKHVVESFDPTTIMGINNYTRRYPGREQRTLPEGLRPLTKSDVLTRMMEADPTVVLRDSRLATVNAGRLRVAKLKQ